MNYKIKITDSQDNFGNPLVKLSEGVYASREDACEAIYGALKKRIMSDKIGLDAVELAEHKTRSAYAKACRAYIYENGGITEDGVTAEVVED